MTRALGQPARLVPLGFAAAISLGTLLLMLPLARAGEGSAPFLVALFTATSATTVTGLAVVDTAAYWSGFGRAVILALIQLGGLGIMSTATLLALFVSGRLALSARLAAQAEMPAAGPGEVGRLLKLVLTVTLAVEAAIALALALRLRLGEGMGWADSLWHGLFHSVSAFNNAGFSTWPDSLVSRASDPWLLGPIAFAVLAGGIGAPVLADLWRHRLRQARWSLHTRLTLLGTAGLLALGTLGTAAFEWANPGTLGALGAGERLLNAAFHSVMTRTAGFNALDIGQMQDQTLALTSALMLVGGGSAGTAGGIKVTTFLLLGLVAWSVIRGQADTVAFGRRIPVTLQLEALTVVLLALGLVACGIVAMLALTGLPLRDASFEVISAFSTVGLSTGITPHLPPAAQTLLVALMFTGRVGILTIATALALRGRKTPYRYPEERPLIG
jgi:trk system potassium uptake protein